MAAVAVHSFFVHGALGVAAVVAAWFTLGKALVYVWRAWRETRKRAVALHRLVERELRPNGGSSLKDQVGRIEQQIAHARERTHDVLNELANQRLLLEEHVSNHPPAATDQATG